MAVGDFKNRGGRTLALGEAWNGSRWSIQPTPNLARVPYTVLRSVSCTTRWACTAVGQSGQTPQYGQQTRTLAARWNGRTWAVQPTPALVAGAADALNAVSCKSATSCVAVGIAGFGGDSEAANTLAERWNGRRWLIQRRAPIPLGNYSYLSGVWCSSDTACIAVGSTTYTHAPGVYQAPLAEAWNGARWSIQSTPNPAGASNTSFLAVGCTSVGGCTAVGNYDSSGYTPLVERYG